MIRHGIHRGLHGRKSVAITKHNRRGMHGTHMPAAALKDPWKHKGQAKK